MIELKADEIRPGDLIVGVTGTWMVTGKRTSRIPVLNTDDVPGLSLHDEDPPLVTPASDAHPHL